MTFNKRRAFHIGGASWLFLCAVGSPLMAQDAAAPTASTQLPEITVTAPSRFSDENWSRRARLPASPAQHPAAIANAIINRNRFPLPQHRNKAYCLW